jgi:hypothetical protein
MMILISQDGARTLFKNQQAIEQFFAYLGVATIRKHPVLAKWNRPQQGLKRPWDKTILYTDFDMNVRARADRLYAYDLEYTGRAINATQFAHWIMDQEMAKVRFDPETQAEHTGEPWLGCDFTFLESG